MEVRSEYAILGRNTWQLAGIHGTNAFPTMAVGDNRVAIQSKLLVGTTTPQSTELYVDGDIVATSYTDISDASLKDNVENVNEAECITMLRAINAKTYLRNDLTTTDRRIGFIAQDVSSNVPSDWKNLYSTITNEDTNVELQTLNYARLNCVLWSVCKQLDARLQALEN